MELSQPNGNISTHKISWTRSCLLIFAELLKVTESHSATANTTIQMFSKTKRVNYYARPCNLYGLVHLWQMQAGIQGTVSMVVGGSCCYLISIMNSSNHLRQEGLIHRICYTMLIFSVKASRPSLPP